MKYLGVSESDIEVSLKSTLYDIKQVIAFMSKHLPADSEETIDYNYYSIQRIKRQLEEAGVRVKEELTTL